MRFIKRFIIHCSASPIDRPYTLEMLQEGHLKRGIRMPGGYHFYIRRDGTIHKLRPINEVGAHAYGFNLDSVGICYEGGIVPGGNANRASDAKDTRTEAQKLAIRKVIKGLYDTIGDYQDCEHIKIVGHRDLSPDIDGDGIIEPWEWLKQCPCYDVKAENYEQLIRVEP